MHSAAARVVGATLAGAQEVFAGQVEHAVNIAGGLHHAMPDRVSGFCVYNDIAVAIRWLLEQGVERIAYVDVDVHHGDGVQEAFWNDPRVLTVSIHESPDTLFPGTGRADEIGGPDAQGYAVNIALPAGTGDQGWLRAFHAITPHLLKAFQPQIIVSQHGCDSHFEDPLANLVVSIDGQRMAADAIHRWAHRYAGGRWLAVGGGGYEWVEVVPRAWTHLIAIAIGKPVPPRTLVPLGFHEYVLELLGRQGPVSMTDGFDPWPKNWDLGHDPANPVDQAVIATRKAVFPHHGIAVDSWQGF
jgi:acetoin utilization protein AcuC